MAILNTKPMCRAIAFACFLCGVISFAQADDGVGETVPNAPQSSLPEPRIGFGTRNDFFPSDVNSPVQRAYSGFYFHPSNPSLDSQVGLVSHGPIIVESSGSGQCLQCVDRDGEGLIGGVGMKLGVGPCVGQHNQCWQCPYNPPFNLYDQGEYAGPARTHRIPEYRLRTGDQIQFVFVLTGLKTEGSYRLAVGDELLIESEADVEMTRGTLEKGLVIQPDGTITLRLIGQIHAAGQTIEQLRDVLEERYKEFYPEPAIDVTPVSTGTAARRIREAFSGTGGFDPQETAQTITPSGEIRLPRIGSVQAQGLTLEELKQEINLRYDRVIGGLEIEPSLQSQAPHNIFVLGEVGRPGRYELDDTPTTVIGAIALAGGQTDGGNLRQVVVFRRGENWELLSTLLDVRGAILGREAHPADQVWVRDGDVIIIPKTPIKLMNVFVRQVFTDGIYGVIPLNFNYVVRSGQVITSNR